MLRDRDQLPDIYPDLTRNPTLPGILLMKLLFARGPAGNTHGTGLKSAVHGRIEFAKKE
jgi:hypothetical protein